MNYNYTLKEVKRTFSIEEVLKNNLLVDALNALNVKGKVRIINNDSFSVKVFVNGSYFGIWDSKKCNFTKR